VPDDVRPTIEHAEVVAAEDLELMGGVRLSVQPTHRASDASMAASRLGDRAASLLPMRKMVDAGAVLSFGTDWPIVPFDPLRTLRAAITGEDDAGQPFYPDQAMTVVEAFMAATFHASEAAGLQPGLVPGGPGDFVLWNGDPFEDICGASVRGTFIDGTLVAGTLPGELNV
jgi:predicted amidohydrolase YtcJ